LLVDNYLVLDNLSLEQPTLNIFILSMRNLNKLSISIKKLQKKSRNTIIFIYLCDVMVISSPCKGKD